MDDHEEGESQRYRDAERDRIRYENIAYILNRHPIDGKHEEYLQAAGKGKRSSRMQSHDGAEKQNPAGHQEQTGTSPSPTPRAASQEKITLNNEPLEENEWPVFLQFKNSMRYKGKVLIDTGCRDNWISKHVIQKHHLPWHEDPNEELLRDFNNSETRSVGLTQSDWVWKNRIIPVEFKIASSAPFDVLFGYKFLLKWELVRLVPESPLAVLVTDKKRPDAGRRAWPPEETC